MWEKLQQWDRELFVYLNSLGIEQHDRFWMFVTTEENWVPLYLIFFILYFYSFKIKKAAWSCVSLLLTFVVTIGITNLVKETVERLRPNNEPTLLEIVRILETPLNYSFFSGHASTSFAVTTFFVLTLRHKFSGIYLFYIWPILFILSRIYVGVHYPGDVIIGAIVGTVIAVFMYLLYKKVMAKYVEPTTLPV